jgi:thioredoxin-related protein
MQRRFGLLVVLLGLSAPLAVQAQPAPERLYTVAQYDPARDPAADLAETMRQAQVNGKRIVLAVGGTWCTWCHALDRYVRGNEAVATALREGFVIMKVNVSDENRNAEFLSAYPPVAAYPHLFVLDVDGTLLHSQGTEALEEGMSYDEAAWLAFIDRWGPPSSP